jgi:hypothetical protein
VIARLLLGIALAASLGVALAKGEAQERGFLGIQYQELTKEEIAAVSWDATQGILILNVIPGTPAQRAGLAADDIITHLDNRVVENEAWFRESIARKTSGSEISLRLLRAGKEQQLTLKLSKQPVQGPSALPGASDVLPPYPYVQTTSWKVSDHAHGRLNAKCVAEAEFVSFRSNLAVRLMLQVRPDGTALLQMASTTPTWLKLGAGSGVTPSRTFFWLGDDTPTEISSTYAGWPDVTENHDLAAAGNLLTKLGAARRFSFHQAVDQVRSGETQGQPIRSSRLIVAYENGAALVAALRACLENQNQASRHGTVVISKPSRASSERIPFVSERLQQARKAATDGQIIRDDARLAVALLNLGNVAADAMRFGEAKAALGRAVKLFEKGNPRSPERHRGLQRLVEVLLEMEELDEAMQIARMLPAPSRWEAAIEIRRGQHAQAIPKFLGIMAAVLKTDSKNFHEWSIKSHLQAEYTTPGQRSSVRDALLLWATAGLGQERLIRSRRSPYFSDVPAYAVAEELRVWLEPGSIGLDEKSASDARQILGRAAYIRGESMRRAGLRQSVETDLQYAVFELEGLPDSEGWAARARVALQAIFGDQGRLSDAIANLQTLRQSIEREFGRDSSPWVEATQVLADLQMRANQPASAFQTATEGIAESRKWLPKTHSAVVGLHVLAGTAALADGRSEEAARAGCRAVGLSDVPEIDEKRSDATLDEVRKFPYQLDIGLEDDKSNAARAANLANDRKKHEIFSAVSGVPAPHLSTSALALYQRHRAQQLLTRAAFAMPRGPKQSGAYMVAFTVDLERKDRDRPFGSRISASIAIELSAPLAFTKPRFAENRREGYEDLLKLNGLFPGDYRQHFDGSDDLRNIEHVFKKISGSIQPGDPDHDRIVEAALFRVQALAKGDLIGSIVIRELLDRQLQNKTARATSEEAAAAN